MWQEVAKIAEIAEFTTKERSKRRRTEKIVFLEKEDSSSFVSVIFVSSL